LEQSAKLREIRVDPLMPLLQSRISLRSLIASFLLVATTTIAAAQTPPAKDTSSDNPRAVMPERPTVATHAFTVATGYLEIETGGERDAFDPRTNGFSIPTVFKIGISERAQLGINTPVVKPPGTSTGVGDLSVGIKYRLVDDAPLLGAFAILPAIKFPTGDDNVDRGTGTTDVSILAISSHKFGDYSMDLNVGYTHRSNGAAPTNATLWTASFGGPLAGHIGWVAECYGYPGTGGPNGQAPVVAVLAGPTLLAMASLAFDVGVIIPVKGPQPHAVYAGLVYNVGRLFSSAK
jgi:hypothetical protein